MNGMEAHVGGVIVHLAPGLPLDCWRLMDQSLTASSVTFGCVCECIIERLKFK